VPDSASELLAGHCYFISPELPMLTVASVGGSELVPISADSKATSDATLSALFESIGETFGKRALAAVLSGAGVGLAPGLRKLLDWGGSVMQQESDSAIDVESIRQLRTLSLPSTAVDLENMASRAREHFELNS
jgi:chemotaxis response regulator CheB